MNDKSTRKHALERKVEEIGVIESGKETTMKNHEETQR